MVRGRIHSCACSKTAAYRLNVRTQCVPCRAVSLPPCPDDDVNRWDRRKQFPPYEFPNPTFQLIAIHGSMTVARDHQSNAGVLRVRSPDAGFQKDAVESLAATEDCAQVTRASKPLTPWKGGARAPSTLRRTCPEAERPVAYDPFFADG